MTLHERIDYLMTLSNHAFARGDVGLASAYMTVVKMEQQSEKMCPPSPTDRAQVWPARMEMLA